MFKTFRKCLETILIIVVSLFLINCLIQKIQGRNHPTTFGYGFGLIMTGSMEPELKVGELVVIKEQETYQKGDIITYDYHTGISVTHRIVDIDGDHIRPQGDQNLIPDPQISINDVYGKVIFHFPSMYIFLGFAVMIICLLIDALLHPDE